MSSPSALPRYNLHEMLVAGIREMVLAGEFRPGDKIPEQRLCEHFEVSRTPLREALKVLAAEGMLQLLPRRGAVVAQVSADEINELFPIMAALEAVAGELVCHRITDPEIARMQVIHDGMLAAYERRDEPAYLQGNRRFHEALVELAGNQTLQTFYAQLVTRMRGFRFVARKSEAQWRAAIEDHGKIMAALASRNGRLLSRLLSRHVTGVTVKIAQMALAEASQADALSDPVLALVAPRLTRD